MSEYIKSPMNYIGGKYRILDMIIPQFPAKINKFVDLFAGGLNVGINVNADTIYANDQINYIIELYEYFQTINIEELIRRIHNRIEEYNLSQTNREGFNLLRKEYNKSKSILDLFILACFSFNHQIRFNSKHEFNTPFGKERSAYNNIIQRNLIRFCKTLQEKNIIFSALDYKSFDFSQLSEGDLVYCDPPYLISKGSYNDGNRGFYSWNEKEEKLLLDTLDSLNSNKIFFVLSNVIKHKNQTNDLLLEWSKKYNIVYLDKEYSNCNYHLKSRNSETVEVLIKNY